MARTPEQQYEALVMAYKERERYSRRLTELERTQEAVQEKIERCNTIIADHNAHLLQLAYEDAAMAVDREEEYAAEEPVEVRCTETSRCPCADCEVERAQAEDLRIGEDPNGRELPNPLREKAVRRLSEERSQIRGVEIKVSPSGLTVVPL